MPRQARINSSTGIYHIMLRGINQQQIFEDCEDNEKFIKILQDCQRVCEFVLYAYSLMGNHLHLLLKVEKEPLEQIFKRIGGRYAYWYNTKYNRVGHLFQDRYKSELVENQGRFFCVLRYIHQNPVKAGIVKRSGDYPFSSYSCYVNSEQNHFVETNFALGMMSIEQFISYHGRFDNEGYLDITDRRFRLTDEQAKLIIGEVAKCTNISEFQLLNVDKRRIFINEFREKSLSIRQISRLTGVSKGTVERYCRRQAIRVRRG